MIVSLVDNEKLHSFVSKVRYPSGKKVDMRRKLRLELASFFLALQFHHQPPDTPDLLE